MTTEDQSDTHPKANGEKRLLERLQHFFLDALPAPAAVPDDAARMENRLARTLGQLSTLMEISQTVAASLDLDKIYDRVLTQVRPLIGADALILFLLDDDMLEIAALDWAAAPDLRRQRIPLDSSAAGAVRRDGRSQFLRGAAASASMSPQLLERTGYRPEALLAVPIQWQDREIGVLEALHHDGDGFDQEDLNLLEMVAIWTAIAIGNARQYRQLQRRLEETDALVAVNNALIETLELDKLLQLIVDRAQKIIANSDWTSIHLLQLESDQLILAASAGLEVDADAYLIKPGEGIAGRVMAEGSVINVADVQNDPRRLPIDLSINARSLLVAPVEGRHRRIGTISVQCARPSTFTGDDERLLSLLGVQAGMAIENARLYYAQEQARRQAERQRERMRFMARRVVEAQEEERERIARELHDESGQALTSLKISLDLIRGQLPDDLADVKESLDNVLQLADKTMSNLRLLSHNLRPPGLDTYGLHAALAGLCQDFQEHTALQVTYNGVELPGLAKMVALTLYRFAQEALTNVAKYAAATTVTVDLAADDKHITLCVADDGAGFEPPDLSAAIPAQGSGLTGMVERLEMVLGQLKIHTEPGAGSRLTAIIPRQIEAA